ncbi:MAG: hypothetical protein AAF368_05890 [Planctomycetota bacterium]
MNQSDDEAPSADLKRPRSRWRRWTLYCVLGLLALSVVGDLLATYDTVAYERDSGDASFRVVAGAKRRLWSISGFSSFSETSSSRTFSTTGKCGFPTNLSSLTIVDVTGSALSRRVAHALLKSAMEIPSVRFAEVRIAGDSSDTSGRIGELVLFVEEFRDDLDGLFGKRDVDFKITASVFPAFGWVQPQRYFPLWAADWNVRSGVRAVSLPTHRDALAAAVIADTVDLQGLFDEIAEKSPAVEAYATALLPESFEAPSLGDVASAAGLQAAPILQGRRIGRKAEAWWRFLAPDVTGRIEDAMQALIDQGWTQLDGGSRGVGGETHHAIFGRGTETVDLQLEESRSSRYVQESWSHTLLPDGSNSPVTHHVEGTPIDNALWVHYWNDCTLEELRDKKAALEANSPVLAADFIAALPFARQAELGVAREKIPEYALLPDAGNEAK